MKLVRNLKLALGGIAVAGLAACGGGGGGGGGGAETGRLNLAVTDAPACGYDAVNVTIEKVRVHQSSSASDTEGGWSEIVLSPALRIDLLSLQNGALAELGEVTLPTGSYNQMRLVLADNKGASPLANSVVLTSDKSVIALTTPSGQQSGVKAKQFNIDIAANQLAKFVIDFDACKSIVATGSGKYNLKPQLSVIPRYVSGVAGSVDLALANGFTSVSLQQGGVVVKATTPASTGKFLLQPVAPGSYTLVMTAPGRSTSVVTNVVVATELVTTINGSTTAFNPAASASATVTGTAPADTLVRVLQPLTPALTGGTPTTVEIAGRFVDGITGSYSYPLVVNAPLVAPYVALPGALVFTSDTAAAGKYTLRASLNGVDKTMVLGTLASGATITTNFTFP
nr:DUF4382 domain-containing protein [Rhodoferax sp.]